MKSKSFGRIRNINSQIKAQAAMEFLMTYGWAILAVVIIIGVLNYSGILGGATLLPERCSIDPSSGLFCEEYIAYPRMVILRVRNVIPSSVNITGASVSQAGNSCNLPPSTSIYLEGDRVAELRLSSGDTCANLTLPGKKLKGDIAITYIRKDLSRTARGDTVLKIGSSAPGVADWDICDALANPPDLEGNCPGPDCPGDLCIALDVLFDGVPLYSFTSDDCCTTFGLCC